jgi:hypothetical protein
MFHFKHIVLIVLLIITIFMILTHISIMKGSQRVEVIPYSEQTSPSTTSDDQQISIQQDLINYGQNLIDATENIRKQAKTLLVNDYKFKANKLETASKEKDANMVPSAPYAPKLENFEDYAPVDTPYTKSNAGTQYTNPKITPNNTYTNPLPNDKYINNSPFNFTSESRIVDN